MSSSCGFLLIGAMALSACKKDSGADVPPYTEQIIFSETFDNRGVWNALPDGLFDPDTSFVSVNNGLLKLTFDPIQYGAAWLGAELEAPNVHPDSIIGRLGIRLKLDQGYFQRLSQYHDTVISGQLSQVGSSVSTSSMRLYFNDIEMTLPSPIYGRTHRDSILDPDAFRIEGLEFEFIADAGQKIFLVDGVEHPIEEVYFNVNGTTTHPLSLEFTLGHNNELDPRVDHLFVDEVEIYTWIGERPQ